MGSLPEPEVDWSEIAAACRQRSALLDRFDPDFLRVGYQYDRSRLQDRFPVEHKSNCNVSLDYSKDPKTWAKGCDCGAIEREARRRTNSSR